MKRKRLRFYNMKPIGYFVTVLEVTKYKTIRVMNAEYNGVKEKHLRFHQGVILALINNFYRGDRNKVINEQSFLSYARNHERFRKDNLSVRYANSKPVNSVSFNVTDIEEYVNMDYKSDF